ncbi:MAG: PQQ-dependent sugar dehydrogenase [Bacteroidota bacterium]
MSRCALRTLTVALFALALVPATLLAQTTYSTQEVFTDASFGVIVDLQHDNTNADRLYVVEQNGQVVTFTKAANGGDAAPFLDIRDRVFNSGELGLLGLAFHPDHATNGRFFVYYTASSPTRSIVAEYARSTSNPLEADPASERILLEVDQPFPNHNAGQIAFGPDGRLYIALGDGGSGGDPEENGEDPTTLLGSILRIDVDNVPVGATYGIPDDNPFADLAGPEQPEIYAYGLRNPWRFSFDPVTGTLWAADVGQNAFEEINLIENGGHYGWDIAEAFACYEPAVNCDRTGLTDPIYAYAHGAATGRSITGGYVYRGPTLAGLTGQYIYGDFVSSNIWALDTSNPDSFVNTRIGTVLNPTSFGTDASGEVYALSALGRIYRFVASVNTDDDNLVGRALLLDVVGPNPFQGSVTLRAEAASTGRATLRVFDRLGRLVATPFAGALVPGQPTDVRFSANGLPAGLYFAQLQAGAETTTRRLVVVR